MKSGDIVTIDGTKYEIIKRSDAANLPNLRHEMNAKGIAYTLYLKRPKGQCSYQAHVYANDFISRVTKLF